MESQNQSEIFIEEHESLIIDMVNNLVADVIENVAEINDNESTASS